MLEVIELFSGIGAQRSALIKANIPHRVVAFCDIDKYAEKSYREIFQDYTTPNLGDITKVKQLPKCDLLTYSFPCTDISIAAGKTKGMNNSNKITTGLFQFDDDLEEPQTRSGLVYEVLRLLNCSEKPKYLLLENVKNLVGKFMDDFKTILDELDKLGYNTYWKVLDAQYYGVPQHRERVYAVSFRKDIDKGKFRFPQGWELPIRLKDILEKNVDEKYYLSENTISKLNIKDKITETCEIDLCTKESHTRQICNTIAVRYDCTYSTFSPGQTGVIELCNVNPSGNVYDSEGLSPTLTTNKGEGIKVAQLICLNSKVNGEQPSLQDRIYDFEGLSTAITSSFMPKIAIKIEPTDGIAIPKGILSAKNDDGTIYYYRIRKLTPLECWRLMGFDDEQFYRAASVNSNTQLYKQAGNSIVVNVLADIFTNLFKEE